MDFCYKDIVNVKQSFLFTQLLALLLIYNARQLVYV
jgi:hypothetical protein